MMQFDLGYITVTPTVLGCLDSEVIQSALRRHASGDWGDLCPSDKVANDICLRKGYRLLSAYQHGDTRFWIETAPNREKTTVMLPDDL
jgi:hypothetical protein